MEFLWIWYNMWHLLNMHYDMHVVLKMFIYIPECIGLCLNLQHTKLPTQLLFRLIFVSGYLVYQGVDNVNF